MPKVSIIIPNYNHATFLKQRIDSVLNQTFQDFEIILLDDCSIDGSSEILKNYQSHPKVSHIIFNQTNSGSPFKQWSKGINLAKGNYIWIAESDDFAETTFLVKCVEILEKHENAGLVYVDSNIIEKRTIVGTFKEKNKIYYPEIDWNKNHLVNGINEIENHLIKNCSIYNVSGVVFRKNNIEQTLKEITAFRFAGDWLCYLLIALKNDFYYISDCLNNYRSHENNATKISGSNYLGMYERIAVRSIIISKLKGKNSFISIKAKQLNLIELRAILGGFVRGRISFILFIKTLKLYL